MDKRWKQLGELLVTYSTQVQPGERVMIAMKELASYPLAHAIYEATIKAGGLPQVQFLSEELNRLVMAHGTDAQVDWVPEIEAYGMEWADVYFGLRGAHNLDVHWDVPAPRLAAHRRAMGKISSLRWEKTRWCLLRVPSPALAAQAGVDEETITDMWFDACLQDWPALSRKWDAWADRLNQGRQVHVVADGTDLSFSVEGRTWGPAVGISNMPDGEISTAPVVDSVNGYITFDFPGVLAGRLVEDIFLRWENGELVEAHAATNEDFLQTVLQTDAGASRVGEFALGTNPAVTHFCKDILIDEKIGGTIHIALGRAYPKHGGRNTSAIHWDIVKDTRKGGEITLDGELIFKDGEILL